MDPVLVGMAIALPAVLPWLVEYWHGEDILNHLASGHIYNSLADPDSFFHEYMHRGIDFYPLALFRLMTAKAVGAFGIVGATRILISGLLLLFPLSVLFLIRRVAPDRWRNILIVVPLVSGNLILGGLFAFYMSLALTFFAVGLLLRWDDGEFSQKQTITRTAGASACLFFSCLMHPVPPVLGGVMLLVLEGFALFRPRRLGLLLVAYLPTFVVVGNYLAQEMFGGGGGGDGGGGGGGPPPLLFGGFPAAQFDIIHLVGGASPVGMAVRAICIGVLLVLVGRGLMAGGTSLRDAALRRFAFWWPLLWIFTPWLVYGFYAIGPRLLFTGVFLAAALVEVPERMKRVVAPAACAAIIGLIPFQRAAMTADSDRIADAVKTFESMEKNSTFVLTYFERASVFGIYPGLHIESHAVVQRDAISSRIFAAPPGRKLGLESVGFHKPPPLSGFLGMPFWVSIPNECGEGDRRCRAHEKIDRTASLSNIPPELDYVYSISPPPEVLADYEHTLQLVAHHGDSWLFTPKDAP